MDQKRQSGAPKNHIKPKTGTALCPKDHVNIGILQQAMCFWNHPRSRMLNPFASVDVGVATLKVVNGSGVEESLVPSHSMWSYGQQFESAQRTWILFTLVRAQKMFTFIAGLLSMILTVAHVRSRGCWASRFGVSVRCVRV